MGQDLCTQLAAEGAHIAMCDMSDESMEETKALCLAANPSVTVTTARCDVSQEAEVLAWRDSVAAEHDTARLALFNNAGIAGGQSFVADPRSQWELTFNVCWGEPPRYRLPSGLHSSQDGGDIVVDRRGVQLLSCVHAAAGGLRAWRRGQHGLHQRLLRE